MLLGCTCWEGQSEMRAFRLGRVLVAHGQLAFVVERRVVHDDHERHHKGRAEEDRTDLAGKIMIA